MYRRRLFITLLLTGALLITACGSSGSPAPAAEGQDAASAEAASSEGTAEGTESAGEEALAPGLPDEPYEAVDYNLYPAPEGGFVGDVMPFVTDDGQLELYYLYDTTSNGQGYHPIYKYSTRNLYEYQDHGMVLNYGLMSEPDPALGTGSVMQDSTGLYHLFYTGHNDTGNNGRGKECAMHATSTDRENWVKDEEPLFFAPEGYSKDDFRDPEVFWVEEDQCYWLLIAANENTLGGVVVKYTSTDLVNWEFVGPIFAPMQQYMCECPDLFNIGDYWYLTYSWDCVTYYAMSDSMEGPFVAPRDNILDGKGMIEGSGFMYYAAKTAVLDDKLYLCGWIGRAGLNADSGAYQWAGNVMVHELVQHEDGTLGVKAPETLSEYFTVDKSFETAVVKGEAEVSGNSISLSAAEEEYTLVDMGTRPATMTLECDVTLDDDGRAGFVFGGGESGDYWTAMCLDDRLDLLHYEGYEIEEFDSFEPQALTKFDFTKKDIHHVKLVCENEIIVLYVDDVKALSCRVQHSVNGAHIGVFSDGCNARFENIVMRLPS